MANEIISKILLYLSDFSKFIHQLTGDLSLPELHYDWLAIFFFIFVVVIVAFSLGRTRMVTALISLYAAAFLESKFIWLDKLREIEFFQDKQDFWLRLALFFVFYFVVFSILNRSMLKQRFTLNEVSAGPILGVAFFEMGFLATIILSYFPPELLERVPLTPAPYFLTKTAQFVWAVMPLLVLLLLKNRKIKPSPSAK